MINIRNETDIAVALSAIHNIQDRIDTLNHEHAVKVAKLAEANKETIALWEREIQERVEAVHAYAAAHRDELTQESKTLTFPTGVVGWQKTRLTVSVRDEGEFIKRANGAPFVFAKWCLDKNALKHAYLSNPFDDSLTSAITEGLIAFSGGGDELFIRVGNNTWKQPA
jgi:phage host-nuclease inhibitor protein Gam